MNKMYKHIPQKDIDSNKNYKEMCGAACLQMIFDAHGMVYKDQASIWSDIKTKRPSANAYYAKTCKVCEYLTKNGLCAEIVKIKQECEIEFLKMIEKEKVPTIILHALKDGRGHFIVFQSINEQCIYIFMNNPLKHSGNTKEELKVFLPMWNQVGQEVTGNIAIITEQVKSNNSRICPECKNKIDEHSLVDTLCKQGIINGIFCYHCDNLLNVEHC